MEKWVRQYDGYVNVLYFGIFGTGGDYSLAFQKVLDFVTLTTSDVSLLKSSTIFIPNGSYKFTTTFILKNGISILGESMEKTIIYSVGGNANEYFFNINVDPVSINISNLSIIGSDQGIGTPTLKGCFYLKATAPTTPNDDGGLWNSRFSNIKIQQFYGPGIYSQGGTDYYLVNQFIIFENVRVFKQNDDTFSKFSNALKMEGENGQITFINCQFDGFRKQISVDPAPIVYRYDNWYNIMIGKTSSAFPCPNVISFINCTIQDSDYGIQINSTENITIDNCWLENLGVAIMVLSDYSPSKSINILNNRFANAAGFGSLTVYSGNIKNGQCVSTVGSVVNVYNNYVTASSPNDVDNNSSFINGNATNSGLNVYGNTFADDNIKLSRTYGILQTINVSGNTIDCKNNKLIFVNQNANPITTIKSSLNAGEIIIIRANGGSINFNNTNNIFLTNKTTFSLSSGEIAQFVKIDIGTNNEAYQLLSVMRTTS